MSMSYRDALDAYLNREGNTETALALRVGVSQPAIHRYRKGDRFPDSDTARRIDEHTSGEVGFSVWQSDFLAKSGLSPNAASDQRAA